MAELHLVIGQAAKAHELTGRSLGIAQVAQPSDNLELVLSGRPRLEDRTGRLDHLEFGFELLDAPTGRRQRVGLEALDPGALPSVDQRLAAPAIEGLDRDPELVGEILDGLAHEHPLTGFTSDLSGG